MANELIRQTVKERRVEMWRVADMLGISDVTLCRKLRHELSQKEACAVMDAIARAAAKKEAEKNGA